jgi:hypothetical protein
VAALVACASLASTAGAQTPAQLARYNRYLSKHPGVAQQLATNGGVNNPAGNAAMQNYYANMYNNQYQKNLATYQNYMLTHPDVAQQMAAVGSPYGSYYPGAQPYLAPTQLTSNPLMATVAPLLGSYPGLQNYMGNYTGNVLPVSQPPYMGSAYPGAGAGYAYEEPPCPRGGAAGYGAYGGAGPYGYGAAAPPYGRFRYGHRYRGGSMAWSNPRPWMTANHNYFGGAPRSQALAMRAANGGPWMGHHGRHWGR